LFQFHTKHYV